MYDAAVLVKTRGLGELPCYEMRKERPNGASVCRGG